MSQFNEDMMRLLSGMIILIPLSSIIQYIPQPKFRYIYSLITSMVIQLYVYQSHMYPIYLQHIISYTIIKIKGPRCGALLTFEPMILLSCYHLYEYFFNYGQYNFNASALLMILVCKYSLLGYALQDGITSQEKLTQEQKRNRLTQKLTFYEFMGYVNFLPTCLIGPPLQFKDYQNFMEKRDYYDRIPSVIKIVAKTLGQTIIFGLIYSLSDKYLPIPFMKSQQFKKYGFWSSLGYSVIATSFCKFRYYFAWKISMCSVHASGVSYGGQDFKKINTIDPWVVQTSIHMRQKVNNWNIGVQEWIRKCIYNRSLIKSKSLNQFYALMVSAFWHGFYLAYYLSFLLWFAQLYLQGIIFKYTQDKNNIVVKIYESLGQYKAVFLAIFVNILFCHNATYFLIIDGNACLRLLSQVYYIPQFILLGLIILFTILSSQSKQKKSKNKQFIIKQSKSQ